MRVVTPIRFVGGTIALWSVVRIAILMPYPGGDPVAGGTAASAPRRAIAAGGISPVPPLTPDRPMSVRIPDRMTRTSGPVISPTRPERATAPALYASASPTRRQDRAVAIVSPTGNVVLPVATLPATVSPTPLAASESRWSGSVYLFHRGDGGPALASGGQLGGSQAGARIAYRLNPAGPTRLALAARMSSPLRERRQAEAAFGVDWHPLPGEPLRVSVERRVDIGGDGRNAWSAYAAGGFWREVRPDLVIDGYAQAGVVGARRGDLFADGALRGGYRRAVGRQRTLTIGAGTWAAAQPDAERIDIGPRVALALPLAGTTVTAATEWRFRVAGNARPRSGLAFTLASDF